MPLLSRQRRAAERHALVDRAVIADLGRLADDDAHPVVDEDAPADRRARMDLDTGQPARPLRHRRPSQRIPLVQHQCAKRCVWTAWNPGYSVRTSQAERAAGSRSLIARMSSRIRVNMAEFYDTPLNSSTIFAHASHAVGACKPMRKARVRLGTSEPFDQDDCLSSAAVQRAPDALRRQAASAARRPSAAAGAAPARRAPR